MNYKNHELRAHLTSHVYKVQRSAGLTDTITILTTSLQGNFWFLPVKGLRGDSCLRE